MSAPAKLELVRAGVPSNVADAAIAKMESQELELESLRNQKQAMGERIAILQQEVNEAQLKAAHQIALSKFSEAQMYQRVLAVENDLNQLRNWIAGNVVQRDQEYENLLSNVSYLMGNVEV